MLVPSLCLVAILWVAQTVMLGFFYSGIKTEELKKTTDYVISNVESTDIQDRIFHLSSNGDINIRVIDTSVFENLYSSGETFDSVTYGWGTYGLWNLYEEARENSDEYVRYYSDGKNSIDVFNFPKNEDFREQDVQHFHVGEDSDQTEKHNFRENFERVQRPAFFENIGRHNDLLYAKISTLSDGTEIMVVADTRISPLDSTVATLKEQLVFCSVLTVIISLIASYVIAKHISKPIENINNSAKVLASGNYSAKFDGKGYREIEELSDTLNFTAEELGKVEGLRRELMANVSHDLRTPLTMIVGYGEMMRDIPGENNASNVQVIIDEANRLSEFVNSILDLSKLQGGMDGLKRNWVDVTELLENAVGRYRKMLSEKGVGITLETEKKRFAMCDEMKITQAVYNLIDNAVNYSNEPKKVVIKQLDTEEGIRVEISDNGDGINPEELPYIWDRYYKSDSNHKRNIVGSGIGLSIVKQILTMHSARYGVETNKGEGSTFWFELSE